MTVSPTARRGCCERPAGGGDAAARCARPYSLARINVRSHINLPASQNTPANTNTPFQHPRFERCVLAEWPDHCRPGPRINILRLRVVHEPV